MGQKQDRREAREALQSVGANLGVREAERIANQTNLSVQQVANIAANQGINVRPAVTAPPPPPAPPPAPPPPTPPPSPTNWLTDYRGPGGGFGQNSYQNAINAGHTPAQIAAALPGSGLAAGPIAQQRLSTDLQGLESAARAGEAAQQQFNSALSEYQARFDEATRGYQSALSDSAKYKSDYEDYKAKYDALDAERKAEQEAQVSQQLSSLRSGSVASGVPGSGLGSLSSGSSAYSRGSAGSSDGVLSNYWRNSDPTDSVLDHKGPVVEAMSDSSGSMAARSEARQRALARGAGSSYYASRFG